MPNPMDIRKNWFKFQTQSLTLDRSQNIDTFNQYMKWKPVKFVFKKVSNSRFHSPLESNGFSLKLVHRQLPEWNPKFFKNIQKEIKNIDKEHEGIMDFLFWAEFVCEVAQVGIKVGDKSMKKRKSIHVDKINLSDSFKHRTEWKFWGKDHRR